MKKVIIVALSVVLLQHGFAQIKVDRSKKPAAGPAPVISMKDPVIFTLPNGMTVLIVENHKLPKVNASLNIDAGPILEGKKAGLADLMGQMLGEGTTTMPKEKFDEAVDMMGAEVSLYSSGGSASALTRYFEKSFGLMADGLKNPAFPQESFDKLKSLTITGLKASEKSAPAIAARVNKALSYGKQTAMGEFKSDESVKGLTLNDVKEAYKNYITPSRSYLTFVGDITPAVAKDLAIKAFGNWTGKKLILPAIPLVKNPAKTEIDFVDLPTAVQGELNIGNLVNNPMNNKDYHAILVANQILGGGAESKLFMNLREKHGFTYGSYSRIGSGRFQSMFTASAAVRTDKVDSATAEIFGEILNMRDGKITQEELNIAKAKYNGSFALGMEDPARTATYASNILINNLPKDFYKTYLQKINSVTLADLKNVAGTYFNETNSRIVIVGNGTTILPKLMRLGYPIKKFDRYADPVLEKSTDVKGNETAKNNNSISASEIIESYLKAIGGKEEVKKITSINAVVGLEMMGRTFEGVEKKMNPNMQMIELKMGTMTVMKSVFDGKSGFQQQGPQKKDMSEKEIKEALDEKGVIPQLYYITNTDYKTDYLGLGKVEDESTYRLKVVMPSGKTSIQEYSVKTGLFLKEETTSLQGDAVIPMTVEYKNYKKFGAVLIPTEVTRNTGGQEIPLKYKDIKLNEGVTNTDFK
ncbi:MAG: insulinase family protein [Ferruginibacter sp.]|nr:insulinase family protein [Ferruginibacter sp.]